LNLGLFIQDTCQLALRAAVCAFGTAFFGFAEAFDGGPIEADIAYEFIRYRAMGVWPKVAKLGGFGRCCDGL
jgi:hypothetical protein